MNRIGKREFYSNPSKYIKPSIFILTSHGKDELKVIVTNIDSNVTNKDPIVTNNESNDTNNTPDNVTNNNNNVTNNSNVTNIHHQKVTTSPTSVERTETAKKIGLKTTEEMLEGKRKYLYWKEKEHRMVHYGCGCKKTDESLCGKHKRR